MSEYIKKDLLKLAVIAVLDEPPFSEKKFERANALIEVIDKFPAADVEPGVRGTYVTDDMGDSSCSICGENWLNVTHKRCPNCGAHMERSGSGDK